MQEYKTLLVIKEESIKLYLHHTRLNIRHPILKEGDMIINTTYP